MHSFIFKMLRVSSLSEELSDEDIGVLAQFITVRDYGPKEIILKPGDVDLQDMLLILGSDEMEASATANGQKVVFSVLKPGDMAGVIGFTGGDTMHISAVVAAKTDCRVLLLDRTRFETILTTHPAIVYYLMRGMMRQMHGFVRRMNTHAVQKSNDAFKTGGRYIHV